jgi:hypothetical protein
MVFIHILAFIKNSVNLINSDIVSSVVNEDVF